MILSLTRNKQWPIQGKAVLARPERKDAMVSFNRVILAGNLTRDPDIRHIPSGAQVTEFSIAVNRTYKTAGGEKKEEVCYVKIITWNKLAENCGKYLAKGRPILIEGRLQSRTWETKEGEKRSTMEVIADRVQFLGTKGESSGREETQEALGAVPSYNSTEVSEGAAEDTVPF